MGMFMAVGRGSDNPPRMIVMRSGEKGEKDALGRHLAIVGKGVCFDSGGISHQAIRPDGRDEDGQDRGVHRHRGRSPTVARLAPGTPLLALAPAVENMPGSHSTRPGDVVKALNGKWVDITNTDAEGRLILGDAMTYAERLGATHLVDVATLTGAVVARARRPDHRRVRDAADARRRGLRGGRAGRRALLAAPARRRLRPGHGELVRRPRRTSARHEGSLVKSGLFLREFVTKPWVHLDIAGTGYFRKALPYAARGATGVTHATLVELALAGAKG